MDGRSGQVEGTNGQLHVDGKFNKLMVKVFKWMVKEDKWKAQVEK